MSDCSEQEPHKSRCLKNDFPIKLCLGKKLLTFPSFSNFWPALVVPHLELIAPRLFILGGCCYGPRARLNGATIVRVMPHGSHGSHGFWSSHHIPPIGIANGYLNPCSCPVHGLMTIPISWIPVHGLMMIDDHFHGKAIHDNPWLIDAFRPLQDLRTFERSTLGCHTCGDHALRLGWLGTTRPGKPGSFHHSSAVFFHPSQMFKDSKTHLKTI